MLLIEENREQGGVWCASSKELDEDLEEGSGVTKGFSAQGQDLMTAPLFNFLVDF